jgi:hypothetical protein
VYVADQVNNRIEKFSEIKIIDPLH